MASCDACNDTGLVEPTPVERVLLERELLVRYGYLVIEPLKRPCAVCSKALERSLMSSAFRMLTTAWGAVQGRR